MAIELVTKFSPKVDELFTQESRLSLLTNKDYDFDGANTVKVYSIGTAPMTDGHSGLRVVEMLEAAMRSLRQNGAPIDLMPLARAS